eukprot:4458924-Karenia_brevis.AAC.1
MYGNIQVQHPFGALLEFDSIADMWAQAMYGYVTGGICADSDVVRVAIVRYEDLLHDPESLMMRLERLGLPRKPEEFHIIEEPRGGQHHHHHHHHHHQHHHFHHRRR